MDRRFLPVILIALLALAPLAAAQHGHGPTGEAGGSTGPAPTAAQEGQREIVLLGYGSGGFYFTLEGSTKRNPDIEVAPGETVLIKFRSVSGFHNMHIDGMTASEYVDSGGETSLTFTAPQSGSTAYWCDPHKSSGMAGKIVVKAAASETPAETPAAPAAPTAYTLLGYAEGGAFYFTLEGQTAKNPTLTVPPNAEITLTFKSISGFHNIHVTGFTASAFVSDGETTTLTFTSPASGSLEYWCDPHKGSGMKGKIQVQAAGGSAPPTGSGSGATGPEVSGPTVDLGSLGHPECAGYLIPKSVAEEQVGGPTVDDYVERCHAGETQTSGSTVTREKHVADYIIPGSVLLIALGIAGTIWVSRSYKP